MKKASQPANQSETIRSEAPKPRPVRADAQRNLDALLEAALTVFTISGVDAPVREIAAKAGVGLGTVYRHFPQRSDLIVAVFRRQIDACAAATTTLAAKHSPAEALALWMQRYVDLIVTKRGLAKALHSGDAAYSTLRDYFDQHMQPAVQTLLDKAVKAGEVRADVDADDLLHAVRNLCMSAQEDRIDYTRRMVAVFADGLRHHSGSRP